MAVKKSSKGSKRANKSKKNRASSRSKIVSNKRALKKSKSARKAPMKGARKIAGSVSLKDRKAAPGRKSLPEGGTTESEASALESSNSTGDV